MIDLFVKAFVRARFTLTSRAQASRQIQANCYRYLTLAEQISAGDGTLRVFVPRMMGIDEEMRNWSFFMILEHNTIVNRSITCIVESLARGDEPTGLGAIDPKRDVMPSHNPGEEQVDAFRSSVDDHLRVTSGISSLRGSRTKQHPVFGDFDAHRWHCMLSLHLLIHYRQAEYVTRKICA